MITAPTRSHQSEKHGDKLKKVIAHSKLHSPFVATNIYLKKNSVPNSLKSGAKKHHYNGNRTDKILLEICQTLNLHLSNGTI